MWNTYGRVQCPITLLFTCKCDVDAWVSTSAFHLLLLYIPSRSQWSDLSAVQSAVTSCIYQWLVFLLIHSLMAAPFQSAWFYTASNDHSVLLRFGILITSCLLLRIFHSYQSYFLRFGMNKKNSLDPAISREDSVTFFLSPCCSPLLLRRLPCSTDGRTSTHPKPSSWQGF